MLRKGGQDGVADSVSTDREQKWHTILRPTIHISTEEIVIGERDMRFKA